MQRADMQRDRQRGSVVICVDTTGGEPPATDEVSRLLDVFDRLGVGATWVVGGAVNAHAARHIAERTAGHELALRVDATAVPPTATRGQVARYLINRQEQLDEGKLVVTSLAYRAAFAAWLSRDVDLLAKHGITTVRIDNLPDDSQAVGHRRGPLERVRGACDWFWASAAPLVEPVSLRFGVWLVPVSMRLPSTTVRARLAADVARACRSVEAAASGGGVFHLVVALGQVFAQGARGEASLRAVVERAVEARRDGQLEVATASQLARSLSHRPRTTPAARSILRPKAA